MSALEDAGIEGFRFHDLRHTAASYMAMTGATQGELMAILGHKTSNMTKRYTHYNSKHLQDLMTRTENKFFRFKETPTQKVTIHHHFESKQLTKV